MIIAENRAARPNEFDERIAGEPASAGGSPSACPFCPGQEHRTPPTVHEVHNDAGAWQVRVVPNKYPAVTMFDECPAAQAASPVGVEVEPAVGAHEVIIETARHIDRTAALSVNELRDVLETYALRLRRWRDEGCFEYGFIFKNQGRRAGASLVHLHSQLIALLSVPPAVDAELGRAEGWHRDQQDCPYCRLLQQEQTHGERMVFHRDGFVAFCPPASLQAFEVWLLPTDHQPWFELPQASVPDRLAGVLGDLLARVESVVPDAAYNLLLRTAPWRKGVGDWCHWRIEVWPRISAFAGFELASGLFINPVAPERAASKLRSL